MSHYSGACSGMEQLEARLSNLFGVHGSDVVDQDSYLRDLA